MIYLTYTINRDGPLPPYLEVEVVGLEGPAKALDGVAGSGHWVTKADPTTIGAVYKVAGTKAPDPPGGTSRSMRYGPLRVDIDPGITEYAQAIWRDHEGQYVDCVDYNIYLGKDVTMLRPSDLEFGKVETFYFSAKGSK